MKQYLNMQNKRTRLIALSIVIAIPVIALIWFLVATVHRPLPDTTTYKSGDFSFVYPRTAALNEYAAGAVQIGTKQEGEFSPFVEVVEYQNDRDVARPVSFDAFVRTQATYLCGSDGPVESATCTAPKMEAFTSDSGLIGQKLSLTLTRKNLKSGTSTSETYGPIYVFNMTKQPEAGGTLRYRALFVYPSFSSVFARLTSPGLLEGVIGTLQIPGGVSTVK